jgi:predicted membrane protein
MKKSVKNTLNYVVSIIILLVSLTITLCDALIIDFDLWVHPILTFLFFVASQLGLFVLVKGVNNKSPWQFFLSCGLLSLALLYVLIQYVFVWLAIVIVIVFVGVMALLSLAVCGNKTENIALNKDPEYKDYKTRMAEKKAQEDNEVKEEVKIKSFKD